MSVRDATESMSAIIVLLGSWVPQLELLEDLIAPDDRSAESLRMRLANDGVLKQTRDCLQDLRDLVTPESGVSTPCHNPRRRRLANAFEKLSWPIVKQDKANKLLQELETHKNSITMILSTKNA